MFTKRKPLNNSLAAAKATCSEIDVVVADSKPDVCLAVFDSRLPIYTMLRTDASVACVEINSASGALLGDDAAVLARQSGEEPAPPRHRAGVASMA